MNRLNILQAVIIGIVCCVTSSVADIYVVNTTDDSGPGTLRQAILDANAHTGADTIIFNIPIIDSNYANGVWTIRPLSGLPDVTDDSTTIDGTSQAAFIGDNTNLIGPEIELDGTNAGASNGISVLSAHNVIKGLVINRFQQFGIDISYATAHDNVVAGNFVGTDATGTTDLGNALSGVFIYSGAKHNRIGGTTESERNVVSGNDWSGVEIQSWLADSNIVIGNYIGTNAAGTESLANGECGIHIWSGAKYNRIGGMYCTEGNVISGNRWCGIDIGPYYTDYNVILKNIIGMNKDVTAAIPNNQSGISLNSNHNIVGGTVADEGNIISGNNDVGIVMGEGSNNTIAGNYIGTDRTGALAFPNEEGGIFIHSGGHDNTIGPGNTIRFNMLDGIIVEGNSTVANKITGNSITANDELGIDNVDGGNTELPAPTIVSHTDSEVTGTAPPNSVVEIFSDDEDEGAAYEGFANADASGNFTWNGTAAGPYVTATATDAANNTSEFSPPYDLTGISDSQDNDLPLAFKLHQNYPNPFNSTTTIRFSLPNAEHIMLEVYSLHGRHIQTLIDENRPAGSYSFTWNARSLPSGIYFLRLETIGSSFDSGGVLEIRKLILEK